MTIELDHATFHGTVADVQAAVDTLRTTAEGLDREVTALLAGGWTGVAARAFADAWADWQGAAGEVRAGLLTIGQLLESVHRDLVERDRDAATAVDQVASRLGTRSAP